MKKKGRPAVGERRKLTRNEVEASGLCHGMEVSTVGKGPVLFIGNTRLTEIELSKGFNKLKEFWDRDTSGKCGKL